MNPNNRANQTILVIQQDKKAVPKVEWIKHYSKGVIKVNVVDITSNIPSLIDDSRKYLPKIIEADLVLDYLSHPDLSDDLTMLCVKKGIPVISPGNKALIGKKHYTPSVCCALGRHAELGKYGEYFGNPELVISIIEDKVSKIDVLRGSPCGSTWKAANKIIGIPVENATIQFGLNTQFFCTANPSGWDPMNTKNPIHVAAEIHKTAIIRAIKNHKSGR